MKKTLKEILHIARTFVILLLLYAMLDLLNVPSRIGFPIENVNWDAAGVLCGNLVVVALFAITYQALDKRSIQKEHNQRRIAVYMLRGTIIACTEQIKLLKKPEVMESVLKKIDFNKTADDDSKYGSLLTSPFADHESIVAFASAGVISEEEFSDYNGIRTYYRLLLTCLITFHDVEELKIAAEKEFDEAKRKAEATLNRA